MEILQVEAALVCTRRVDGLHAKSLRVLRSKSGARPGNWVFTVMGSAARYAAGDFDVHTDLTIGGIIDDWETES